MADYQSQYTGAQHDAYVTKTSLINLIYPVGAIYMSVNSTSPATLFGGTWVAIAGKFLVGADSTFSAGETGGSDKHTHTMAHTHTTPATTTGGHTLTLAEAPAHTHGRGTMEIKGQWKIKGDSNNAGVDAPATASGAFSAINETASGSAVAGTNWGCGTGFNFTASNNWTGVTDSQGGGGSHTHPQVATTTNSQSTDTTSEVSNLPPYLAVYMWKRTA